jgi:hypothetical protein
MVLFLAFLASLLFYHNFQIATHLVCSMTSMTEGAQSGEPTPRSCVKMGELGPFSSILRRFPFPMGLGLPLLSSFFRFPLFTFSPVVELLLCPPPDSLSNSNADMENRYHSSNALKSRVDINR